MRLDELWRLRAGAPRAARGLSDASSSNSTCRQATCRSIAASSGSRTCRPTRRAATSAAPRSTTSRSRRCASGSRPRASKRVVIGISGGLDSTQAALVAVRAFDRLGLPRTQHPRLHAAGLRHQPPHVRQCARADAGARHHGRRDRHPPVRRTDAAAHRPSGRAGQAPLRHHLRERAGGRAHLAPVPARQPARRAGARHRATCRSWRSASPRTASATTCRTTT